MAISTALDDAPGRLNAYDPGLSYLATQAAIQLDNLLLGEMPRLDAVVDLANRLQQSTEIVAGEEERRSLMNPATVSLISNAIRATGATQIRTISDLTREAWQIASELQGIDPNNADVISRMRSFCMYLAQAAMAHEQSLQDTQTLSTNWS